MDSKTFIAGFARRAGLDTKAASAAITAISTAITDTLASMDSVAIPSFGTFESIKKDETVTHDLSTNKRILLPPVIEVRFNQASSLTNSIKQ